MTIVNEKTLCVRNAENVVRTSSSNELSAVVRGALRNGVGKTAGWVVVSIQDVNDGVARFLTGDASPDQCRDVGVVDPCFDNGRSDGVGDNNCVVVVVRHCGDHVVGIAPERQVLAARENE